ncbi:MAG: DNA-protecting protein DprA [Dysgonamonadaceae bacterium]|jgi:DNA processing protein|nr:DNA-protecting protein DprA [Dysgonamonadaceae bacterium]
MKNSKEFLWYLFANTPGFGVKSIHYIYEILMANNMTVNNLFAMKADELCHFFPEIGQRKFSKADFFNFPSLDNNQLYDNFLHLKNNDISIIGLDDERYPKSVKENMKDIAPPVLYCKGQSLLLQKKGISIVGARDVNDYEVNLTKKIAYQLAENKINVTSGYAKGVDTAAHTGALEAHGTTTMILSFGTNHISIKREIQNFEWKQNALFVTQFAPYEKFSGHNAMTRNKLVCAMSDAIVVIKSGVERGVDGKMSGTFDAGKSALQMGIPVFVLSPHKLKSISQGNIDLIKLGGMEISNEYDIVDYLNKPKMSNDKQPDYFQHGRTHSQYQLSLF